MPETRPPQPTAEQLVRLLAGECSPAERNAVQRQLDAHPELARAVERYVRALDGEGDRPAPPDAAASFAALTRRIAGAGQRRVRLDQFVPRRPVWRRAIGAGVLVAATVVATVWYEGTRNRPAAVARTFATAAGQRTEVRLDDGTRVELAPASRVRVAADFGRVRRDVYLDGEAYFEVAHDATHPFTVFAGRASVRDVGTAFAVRAFAGDSGVQVVVRTGVVAMSGVGRLDAGDVGRLDADGRASITHGGDVDALLGWVDGRLQFTDAPLARVLVDLHRWYGVDVGLADSTLGALPFTGVVSGVSPSEAVSLVAVTLGLRVQDEGGRLVLHSIRGRTPRPRPSFTAAR